MTEKDYALSGQMMDYLCNFVKTGNPNGENLPEWIATSKSQNAVLCLGERNTQMAKPSILKMIKTMLTNKAVGE